MIKTFMLLLAFTITGPDGEIRDEKVHVLSRHFDTQTECRDFIHSCLQKDGKYLWMKSVVDKIPHKHKKQ